jgi:glycosyltransferase involved in cell wall biosynthesis
MDYAAKPKLSIVIPCFNAAAFLPETLRSLQNHLGSDVEIILVDDGSTDETSNVVKPFISENVRYYAQKNSGGPASPRNVGIEKARSDLIGFFDADDLAITGHFLASAELMRINPEVGMVCGNFHISDEALNIQRPSALDESRILQKALIKELEDGAWLLTADVALSVLLQKNFVGTASVIIRRSVFDKVGGFDESLKNLDDRDMWLRVARHYDFIYRNESTYIYRSVPSSISKQRLESQAFERIHVGHKLIAEGLPNSQRKMARQWIGCNHLAIGHSRFEQKDLTAARSAFRLGFFYAPCWPAFKGVVKSVLPRSVYLSMRGLKRFL